ncbi:MAG TPA: hydrogen gas-evolving membrane-bound hydrogenase subunit E [Gaiellaceae bacterium]|nr:hydrogen gas-evolving membrane-bound hydrogenase subunit E [Gaiellaceae bacterium]
MRRLSRIGASLAALGFGATLAGWAAGGWSVDLPWAATLGLRLAFELDGLAVLYSLLATGIGFAVFVYSGRYLPLHLAHQGRPQSDEARFYGWLVLFMVSMVGLATAQDLILLFVFWDLTALASYFLIGYDRAETEARTAALMALVVTGVTAVFLLVGTLMLYAEYETFSLPELIERVEPGTLVTAAAGLMALAGLAKSAQVPFQFWLPRAMVAPTPVSAYLHAAAMVAAGVFLIGRLYPLVETSAFLLDALVVVGLVSMAVGGVLALTRDRLKQLLAYSTISQYGYVVTMYGLGGSIGAVAASFYVVSHALAKSALFLTAGAVTEATGEERLSRLGGLARSMPLLALGSGLAAAGLAALPLTIGFFKDELFFEAALERSWLLGVLAVLGAALTFAYIGRFWAGVFLGPPQTAARSVPAALVAPVVALGAVVLLGGLVVEPFTRLASDAASVSVGSAVSVGVAYHLDLRAENLMALAVYALGALALWTMPAWESVALAVSRVGQRAGPERLYLASIAGLNRFSDRIHGIEVRDLRTRIAAILVPGGVLILFGLAATPTAGAYSLGTFTRRDVALILVLLVTALAALSTTFPRQHLTLLLVAASVGFSLAVVYAFMGGPDVALVAALIETTFALLFIGVFALLPRASLRRLAALRTPLTRRWRDPVIGVAAALGAFLVVWGALSRPSVGDSVAEEHLRLAPEAHAKDVVTAILADFRGLDTLGEITVVAIAFVGIATLLRRGRLW